MEEMRILFDIFPYLSISMACTRHLPGAPLSDGGVKCRAAVALAEVVELLLCGDGWVSDTVCERAIKQEQPSNMAC